MLHAGRGAHLRGGDVLRAGDADVVDVEQRRRHRQEREPDRAEHARHDEQHAQPAAAGLALHLDAALADARVDARRASASVGVGVVVILRPPRTRSGEADELQLGIEPHTGRGLDPRLHQSHEREHVVGARAGLGHEEVGVLLRHDHSPDPQALEPARLDEPARRRRRAGS